MNDALIKLLESLGEGGIRAYYIYLTLDYLSLWIFFALSAWGIKTVWNKVKEDF